MYTKNLIAIIFFSIWSTSIAASQIQTTLVNEKLEQLEISSHVTLGVYAVNTGNDQRIEYRADETFQTWSTFKILPVAAILKESMKNPNLLTEHISYSQNDVTISGHSPITQKYLSKGMTIAELCAAALQYSDNAATNLLMKKLGGYEAVVSFNRSLGDSTFMSQHLESSLDSAIYPTNLRFTSTPTAMEQILQAVTHGDILGLPQREQLLTWMKNNTTGDKLIRAGVPKGWIVANKTGAGDYGVRNDIAVIWPRKCAPIFVAIYSSQDRQDAVYRDDLLSNATRILIDEFSKTDQCINLAYTQ